MNIFRRRQRHQPEDEAEQNFKLLELRDALGPLSGRSLKYCSDACLKRYLEARNWNVERAKKMLEDSLKWRSTFKPEEIRWHEIAHEGETGKVYRTNLHDLQSRPVLILRPGKQNSNSPDDNIRYFVYLLENAVLNLPPGQEQMVWLLDFTGWSLSTQVPIKLARDMVHILQNHYPERMFIAFMYNPPRIFEAFYRAVKYFLDPKTAQKVKFVYPNDEHSEGLMMSYFNIQNLPTEFGGQAKIGYDHQEFSRMMAEDDVKTAKFWGFEEKPYTVES